MIVKRDLITCETFEINEFWKSHDYVRELIRIKSFEIRCDANDVICNNFLEIGFVRSKFISKVFDIDDLCFDYKYDPDHSEKLIQNIGELEIIRKGEYSKFNIMMYHYISIREGAIPFEYHLKDDNYPFDFYMDIKQKYALHYLSSDKLEQIDKVPLNSLDWWDTVELTLRWNGLW